MLAAGYIVRYYDEGPTYAWVLGHRLGAFSTDTDARKAVQDQLKKLMATLEFKGPDV